MAYENQFPLALALCRQLRPDGAFSANGYGWYWNCYREDAGGVYVRYFQKTRELNVQTRERTYLENLDWEIDEADRFFGEESEADALVHIRSLLETEANHEDGFALVRAFCLGRPKDDTKVEMGVPLEVIYRNLHSHVSWYIVDWNGWTLETGLGLTIRYNAYLDLLIVEEEEYAPKRMQVVSRREFPPSQENEAIAYLRSLEIKLSDE